MYRLGSLPRRSPTESSGPRSHDDDEEMTLGISDSMDSNRARSTFELYRLCETALSLDESSSEKLDLVSVWESIRHCLEVLPSMQERQLAATHRGQDSTVAIHLLCKTRDPPLDIIEALILHSPETLEFQDSNGWLPLHHATANKNASIAVLKRLISAFPAGARAQDSRQRTPLHFAFVDANDELDDDIDDNEEQGIEEVSENDAEEDLKYTDRNGRVDIVELLSSNGAAEVPDENGMLPMHYACAYGNRMSILKVLWEAYPQSIVAGENSGRTPLHLAMANAHRRTGPVEFLTRYGEGTGVVDIPDDKRRLPMNILAKVCKSRALSEHERLNASKCLNLYLDSRPEASADFINAMRETPQWLRDDAVMIRYGWKEAPAGLQKRMLSFVADASPKTQSICFGDDYVRAGINRLFIKRPILAVMMCDLYCQILLVIAVSSASFGTASPEDEGLLTWQLVVLIVAVFWFALRELLQMISYPFRLYISDYWNWIDMLQIALIASSLAVMNSNGGVNDSIRVPLLTMTVGIVWFELLGVSKNFLYGVSVFLSSLQQILVRLVPFMAVTAVTVAAFVFMLHTSNKNLGSCNETDEDEQPWYCGTVGQLFADLLAFVFSMRELEIEITTTEAIINGVLYAFGFIIALILLNVLIAKISNVFSEVEEKGDYFFWADRVSVLTEAESLLHLHEKAMRCIVCSGRTGNSSSNEAAPRLFKKLEQGLHKFDANDESTEQVSDAKDALLSGEDARGDRATCLGVLNKLFAPIVSPIVFVCFFIAGCVSFGILWPKWMSSAMFSGKYENFDDLKGDISNVQKNMASNVKVLEKKIAGIRDVTRSNTEVLQERITHIEDALKRIEKTLGALLDDK